MNEKLISKIDFLPPLPQTAIDIDRFKNSADKDPVELIKIVEKDPLIVSTLLKVSNSAMFGFKKKIESAKMAVSLLGVNFTISLALGSAIKNCIETSLDPYSVNTETFLDNAALSSSFAAKWIAKLDSSLQDRVLLPAFLLKTGMFVISMTLEEDGNAAAFKEEILGGVSAADAEIKYVGVSTPLVTAAIFKHWKLSETLIQDLENIQNIFNNSQEDIKVSQILYIINSLCNISHPFNDICIENAIKDADKFGFDIEILKQLIAVTKENLF